jgi:uncharacterized protein YbjT (DUF2867 family)
MAKILVTGATGTVGSNLVEALRARGADVRVGVRSPEKAARLAEAGVEVVKLDFDAPETLASAMAGVERLFLLSPFTDELVAPTRAAMAAANTAGVTFVLRISALGASEDAPLALGRKHGAADKAVIDSGIPYALILPTFFQDNIIKFHLGTVRGQGAFYGASGTGSTSYISSRDIAEVAAAILLAPDAHLSKSYVLTGPEAVSDGELAGLISKVTGREVKYIDLPPEQLAGGMREQGAPEWMIEALIGLEGIKAAGYAAEVSPAVEQILGHKGETYESFLQRHKDAFAG